MAWNPNIPTVTNRVQDDLDAIRKNFQHLDQLAERVDELQTVSELAPIANDLQTVSGLAQITDDLQVVSALAPYVQALLDSRIVEMGSNSNGEYVRWENGLQVCWRAWSQSGLTATSRVIQGITYYYVDLAWTFPASFVANPVVMAGGSQDEALYRNVWSVSTTQAWFACRGFVSFTSVPSIFALAIGWWK